jgi:antitoxin ParD1/3/4
MGILPKTRFLPDLINLLGRFWREIALFCDTINEQKLASQGFTFMNTINISLPDSVKAYLEKQVASGNYNNISDYIWELIVQDQKRKTAKERLEELLLEALDSGEATPMTDIDWEQIRQTVRNNVLKEKKPGFSEI